jgi:hypothetical protein
MTTSRWSGSLLTCAVFCLLAGFADAAPAPRRVEVRWDFTKALQQKRLEIWVNCTHDKDLFTCAEKDFKPIVTPSAESFVFRATDVVTIVAIFATDGEGEPDIRYAITGTNLDDKDLDALKKLFGAAAAKTDTAKAIPRNTDAKVKAVTDPLIAGGKLTVTIDLKVKDAAGKEAVVESSGGIAFNIEPQAPRITVSYGFGFGTAANPTVAINKTSTIVSFTKDGKPQQAYQQIVTLRDSDDSLKPIQSLVTFANFRLVKALYASAGVPLNEKIFERPILGGTYRLTRGKVGLNVTLGVQFSHETQIVPGSGFADGTAVDPTLGLTADDVPIEKKWHRRLALGFTIDFQ